MSASSQCDQYVNLGASDQLLNVQMLDSESRHEQITQCQ